MARGFNGTSDGIDVGNVSSGGNPLSLSAWINPFTISDGNYHVLLTKRDESSNVTEWGLDQNAQVAADRNLPGVLRFYLNNGGFQIWQTNTVLAANEWFHVAVTYDGSGNPLIYVNGAAVTVTQTFGSSHPAILPNSVHAVIGSDVNITGSDKPWTGNIAEVSMWVGGTVLTPGEIEALAGGTPPSRLRTTSLKGYWPLWGLTSPEPDLSGNQFSGTLTGTTQANHAPVTLFTRKARVEVEPAGGGSNTFNAPSLTATWNLPQPTIRSTATFDASSVSATWSAPQPAIVSESMFSATTLSATWDVPQPTIGGEAPFNAPALESVWSLPRPDIASECTLAVAAASAIWNIPAPTIAGTSLLDANAGTATWNLPQPTITQSNPFVNGNELVFTARDPGRHFVARDPGRHFQGRGP